MKEQLLIECWGLPGEVSASGAPLIESVSDESNGALYITGVFMQANVRNRNGRIYPKAVLQEAVDKYIREQVTTRQALGETNHPPRPAPDPSQASIIIESLWWEGDNVMGRARVIEGDYGPGDKLAANIRAGWVPGVSSRGLGSVNKTGVVQEGFKLTVGVDAVWGPSAPDAYVKPIRESAINTTVPESGTPSADEAFRQLASNLASTIL